MYKVIEKIYMDISKNNEAGIPMLPIEGIEPDQPKSHYKNITSSIGKNRLVFILSILLAISLITIIVLLIVISIRQNPVVSNNRLTNGQVLTCLEKGNNQTSTYDWYNETQIPCNNMEFNNNQTNTMISIREIYKHFDLILECYTNMGMSGMVEL